LSVSVLIPAFRPTFLGQAIASVLAQGHEDFELIVSDDSGGDAVRPVVERFRDPRVRYVKTAGRTGPLPNMRGLWQLARYDLLSYLFDDDVLMPHALGAFVDELAMAPDLSFVFGRRQTINNLGRVTDEFWPLKAPRMRMDERGLAQNAVGRIMNPIGEFSNVLVNRASGVTQEDFTSYRGFAMHVVADVGFYLNATRHGHCVGINRLVSSFRKHADQNSSPAFNPLFAIGICEWELFIRGEYSCGALSKPDALAAIAKLSTAYTHWSRGLPLIARMAPSLAELRQQVEDGEVDVLDDRFRVQWAAFVDAVMAGKAVAPQT